jgi:Tol biopolymer transport system component
VALQPSTRLGPYEILSAIGAGGMGEVYKARDTRLDRTVAIKVLPEHRSSTPQARERFEREAKAISSLSHPHICPLYDVGHQDGIDYLVMEYLEGETLAHRLKKGALPPDQVLQVAIQITDALDAAHRHWVIHRDLKPGNIMLTKSGAKLLDFGLAKVRGAEAAAGLSAVPTATTPLTAEGTILGTMQYMAPEQLEGKEADVRTDIFALGAVIYEMATGKKAFEGKSQASLISAIMTAEPPPISTLESMTPVALDHVVRTCLAKEPDSRWHTAHDVLVELKWITEAGSEAGAPGPLVERRKSRELLSWALTAVVSLALLTVAVVHFRERVSEMQSVRFLVPMPDKVTFDWWDYPVISPDGRRFVIPGRAEGKRLLWIHSLDSLAVEPLPATEDAYYPFWSPDSRFVGFFTIPGKLQKINVTGGAPQTLCDVPPAGGCAGGAWNRNGVILFATYGRPLRRISEDGGEPQQVLDLDKSRQEVYQAWPHFLPNGHDFLYLALSDDAEKNAIFVGSLDSKRTRLLIHGVSNVNYAESGFLVYGRQRTLLAQPFNAKNLRLTAEPLSIAQHVGEMPGFPATLFSASQNGVLVYRSGGSARVQLSWYNRNGKRLESIGEPELYGQIVLSPDEKRLAAERMEPLTSTTNIWIIELSRGIVSRVTFSNDYEPVWSPDGRELVFLSFRAGKWTLYRKVLGGGTETLLFESHEEQHPGEWAGDGKSILLTNSGSKAFSQLPLTGQRKPVALLKSDFDKDKPSVSPDGRLIAYESMESGRWEIYVATFSGFSQKRQVSNAGGGRPLWRKDGKELFYLSLDGKLMAVDIKAGSTIDAGAPQVLFQTRIQTNPRENQYCATHDGQRFLLAEPVDRTMDAITVVVNWAAGLKR